MIQIAAMKSKGASCPSGLDTDGWRKMLVSNSYGTTNTDLKRVFASVIKKIYIDKVPLNREKEKTTLEHFLVCTLIPLNINHVPRPIGVGEILQRIEGKMVMKIGKEDWRKSSRLLMSRSGGWQ